MKTVGEIFQEAPWLESKVAGSVEITGVTSKANAVQPGNLFIAIRGTKFNGHDFLDEAKSRGAAALVVETPAAFKSHSNTIRVASTRRSLAELSAAWFDFPSRNLKLVGVTGTNGKTTFTYLLKSIWQQQAFTTGLIGTVECQVGSDSYPSQLTTPDPLELQKLFATMVEKGVTHAAMEVSSIALDQMRTWGTRFDTAVYTNFTQDHLDYHKDMDSYFRAKALFFETYPYRVALLNADDERVKSFASTLPSDRCRTFSLSESADYQALEIQSGIHGFSAVFQSPQKERFSVESGLVGRHNVSNCLAAWAAAIESGVSAAHAAEAIQFAHTAPGRLEKIPLCEKESPAVYVDYAHTEDALQNVLSCLSELAKESGGRLITVFGCGGDRDAGKRPKMGAVASRYSDITILTSDNPRTENPEAIIDAIEKGVDARRSQIIRESNRRLAIEKALATASAADFVLVAGKGHETYQIIGKETLPFDDRAVIRDYYRK